MKTLSLLGKKLFVDIKSNSKVITNWRLSNFMKIYLIFMTFNEYTKFICKYTINGFFICNFVILEGPDSPMFKRL